MAYILVDGYNLIGTAHDNLEKARSTLVEHLREYAEIRGHHVTIVFDGWKDGRKDETSTRSGNVSIIYSRLGDTADHVIRKTISSTSTPWIVVSSDRAVYDFAVRREFAAITADEFEQRLYDTLQMREEHYGDDAPGVDTTAHYPSRQRGNPKKLSKRERKKLQALRKL